MCKDTNNNSYFQILWQLLYVNTWLTTTIGSETKTVNIKLVNWDKRKLTGFPVSFLDYRYHLLFYDFLSIYYIYALG